MMNTIESDLASVTAIDATTGVSQDGKVKLVISGISEMQLRVGHKVLTIPTERGETDEGQRGWIIYPKSIYVGEGEDPLLAAETDAVMRVVKLGLDSFGYHLWVEG